MNFMPFLQVLIPIKSTTYLQLKLKLRDRLFTRPFLLANKHFIIYKLQIKIVFKQTITHPSLNFP